MPSKRILVILSALTAFTLITPALAAISVPDGWYGELNVGITKLSNTNYSGAGSVSSSRYGANVNVGYKFMPYFASELGYTQYSNATIKVNGTTAGTTKNYSWDIAGKGIVPIGISGAEIFAKLGIARANARVSISNTPAAQSLGLRGKTYSSTGAYFGGGIQYNFAPEMGANIQWMRVVGNSNNGNLDFLSVGVNYIFS